MGYYNDVRYVMHKDAYVELVKFMSERHTDSTVYFLLCDEQEPEIYEEHGEYVLFGWNCIKMNSWCTDINVLNEGLEYISRDLEYEYNYARVGEEYGDIEICCPMEEPAPQLEVLQKINIY